MEVGSSNSTDDYITGKEVIEFVHQSIVQCSFSTTPYSIRNKIGLSNLLTKLQPWYQSNNAL